MALPETLLALALGIALAAAAGLRVFLPLLVVALAAWSGHLQLSPSLAWLATLPAVVALGAAALAEIAAYYLPGVDNLLDVIAAPLALVAGTLLVAAPLADVPPLLQWSAAVVAGGGAAGITQGVTSLLRAKSTATTGGLGNPVVASGELAGSLLLSLLAIVLPLLALIVAAAGVFLLYRLIRRLIHAPRGGPAP